MAGERGRGEKRWRRPAGIDETRYRINRSASPEPETFSRLADGDDAFVFEDPGEGAGASSFYHAVIAINACGREGP